MNVTTSSPVLSLDMKSGSEAERMKKKKKMNVTNSLVIREGLAKRRRPC